MARRWELAAQLRQLRIDAGKSLEDAAGELMCSVPKLSRLETGGRGIQPRDVRDLCRLYGVPDEQAATLMRYALEARERGWWQDFRTINEQVATYLGLESAASVARVFEAMRIPGLLQTESFTRALLPHLRPPDELSDDWIDDTISARVKRQERIASRDLRLEAVIDEAALRRPIGGPDVMRAQIERLIVDGKRPNVSLHVIPFDRGPHPGMEGSFEHLSFARGSIDDLVFVEGLMGTFILDKAAEADRYKATFTRIRSEAALDEKKTLSWLGRFLREMNPS
jgi:transcriptional regulator with XRE-family HTH domain